MNSSITQNERDDIVKTLLTFSRECLQKGSLYDSLSAVLQAINITQGEDAILGILTEAKQKVEASLMEQRHADELEELEQTKKISALLVNSDSVLKDQGNEVYLKEAFENGSSLICRRCGALVLSSRWSAHTTYWCESVDQMDSEIDLESDETEDN